MSEAATERETARDATEAKQTETGRERKAKRTNIHTAYRIKSGSMSEL